MKQLNTKVITATAAMIALSAVGALIKIEGSIAFDSLPAFAAAILISPLSGGIVGLVGHFLTASTSGFPFGFTTHLITAISMFFAAYSFGYIRRMKKSITFDVLAVGSAIIFNLIPLLYVAVSIAPAVAWGLLPGLSIAALLNIVLGLAFADNLKRNDVVDFD